MKNDIRRPAVVIGAAVFSLTLAGLGLSANPDRKTDASGDAVGEGGDIASVVVSNDAAGVISFVVATPNHTTLQITENIQLYIDFDRNPSTGTNGYEFRIHVFGGSSPPVGLSRWTGSEWAAFSPSSFSGSFQAGLSAKVAKGDLGISSAFQYSVITIDGKTGQLSDRAPDGALTQRWTYTISTPSVDADKDGVVDAKDKCRTTPAGKFDRNRNGCPGPYPSISAGLAYTYTVVGRSFEFTSLVVKGAPAGSDVALTAPGVLERLKGTGRPLKSTRLVGRKLTIGGATSLAVTKPGMVGYVGRFAMTASGLKPVSRVCTRPTGGKVPIACGRVDRGK